MTFDLEHAKRLVRQHMETAALLGADVVPVSQSAAIQVENPASESSGGGRTPDGERAARLAELRQRYEAEAPHAPFISEFTSIVFDDGDPNAKLMFVGEAPGADEDKQGVPFVGRAGQLLNKMISAMELSRETVYIANVLKVRPPNNATPTPDEIEASKPFLIEQIQIVRPEVIVALGLPAAKCLLGVNDSMAKLRARFHDLHLPDGTCIPVMPTYHPAYLLRSYTAENRGKVWSDLQMVIERLGLPTAR
ncbi:MAG: uracil-DNA glycosylase [Planctomycetota bacterium]